jgi:hypothetical protein
LRAESAWFIISILCFVFSIYLAGLSLYVVDGSLRVQFLTLATSFFAAGIIVLIYLGIFLALKKALKF